MACSQCVPTPVRMTPVERTAAGARCWFGEDGLYHYGRMSLRLGGDTWIFGLEDKFFPLASLEEGDTEEVDSEISGISAVDGLSDEFMHYLEKRLDEVMRCSPEGEAFRSITPPPVLATSSPGEGDSKPVPPVRRKRLQRSQSLLSIRSPFEVTPPPCSVGVQPVTSSRKGSHLLTRSGSVASDLIQRVKRWAVTSTFRKAFRNRSSAPSNPPLHTIHRFFTSSNLC